MSSGKASPQPLLQGIKKTKSGRATTSRYTAEEVGGGGGCRTRRRSRGTSLEVRPRRYIASSLCLHYVWYLFFNMLLNCLPFPIVRGQVRGRGQGRAIVLLSEIPSASSEVA